MKKLVLFLGFLVLIECLFGQTPDILSYPEVGKPMPDITIRNISYYPKKEASLKDFKGKWLLLDFWNIHCGACVASFPHVNVIQQKLADKIQIMLIGIQDEGGQIAPFYKKIKERQHLIMPCAFDSVLANRLDIYVAPHSILIDDKGIVQCITSSFSVLDIQGFLDGKAPILPKSYRRMHEDIYVKDEHYDFDSEQPFLVKGNGGEDTGFLFRSILSLWDHNLHRQYISEMGQDIRSGRFQVLGVPLEWLFNYAYFGRSDWGFIDTAFYGKYYVHPILEISDSSKFKYSFKYSRNIYSYSLIMPPEKCTIQSIKKALQRDLETYFGFQSRIEIRNCPCWKLVANKGAKEKLMTKGGAAYYKQLVFHASFVARNYPFKKLVDWIKSNQQDEIILDETDILGNVDISMDCIPTDMEDLKKSLHVNGLDLILSERPMYALVIRDEKEQITMK